MIEFPRIVLGFHGCLEERGAKLVSGEMRIEDWPQSNDRWDWLGKGAYFWEHAPERAWRWAQMKAEKDNGNPYVVGAVIQLEPGRCFDLTNVHYTDMLSTTYPLVEKAYGDKNKPVPENRKRNPEDDVVQLRERDCLVINWCIKLAKERKAVDFSSVRGAFWEGDAAFPGAKIQKESHIQIAVRDPKCIVGVFRPRLSEAEERGTP